MMKTKFLKFLSLIPIIATVPTIAACGGDGGGDKPTPSPTFDYEELENPTCIIKTENGQAITSKDTYINATFTIKNCDESQKLTEVTGGIRGRGNLSWTWPKKSYSIKFDEKQYVFGSNNDYKKWALISNYGDPSLYRNFVAYTLASKLDKLIFSPSVHMVDLYLNDKYLGDYMFCDRIEAKKGRVKINTDIDPEGNNGYLVEQLTESRAEGTQNVDWIRFSDKLCFQIKSPDTEDEEYLPYAAVQCAYIKNYIQSCFDALDSSDWEQVTNVMNVDTFVDGYIIEELFCNLDCHRFSMYYYKDKGDRLCHGPVWDFDLSSGNLKIGPATFQKHSPTCELWGANNNIFYNGLFKYQEFKDKVAARLVEFKPSFEEVMTLVDPENADGYYQKSKQSLERNFQKWNILGTSRLTQTPTELKNIKTLSGQLSYLKQWLETRYNYLQAMIK